MIAIDTSALIAIITQEPAKDAILRKIEGQTKRLVSIVTRVETLMGASRIFADCEQKIQKFLRSMDIESAVVDDNHLRWARHAFMTYGKGRHAARLNICDCFSYAAAKVLDAPLLYVGDDFAKTDIRSA